MATRIHMANILVNLYPTSNQINDVYMDEMVEAFAALSDDDFDLCLAKHRKSPDAPYAPAGPRMVAGRLPKYTYHTVPTECTQCGKPTNKREWCDECMEKSQQAGKRAAKRFRERNPKQEQVNE